MPIEAVIFDIDGTLIDSVDAHAAAWVETFAHFGWPARFAAVRAQIGKGGDQLMPVFLPKDVIAERGEEVERFRSDLFKRKYLGGLRPFPGVAALFARLGEHGLGALLASSAKADELERYKKIAGVEGLVEETASSHDAQPSKPAPDIFVAALRKARLAPDRAVAIGDSPHDAQAAGAAGMRAIGVLCGGFPEADLRAAGCRAMYADPQALLRDFPGWLPA